MAAGIKVEGMKSCWKDGLLTDATHIALFTGEPGSTNEFDSTNSPGYARQALTKATWTISNGVATYGADIEFASETSASWQTVAWVAFMDASTGGNILWTVDATDLTIGTSRRVYIGANSMTLDLDTSGASLTASGASACFTSGLFSSAVYVGFTESDFTEITGTGYGRTSVSAGTMAVNATSGVCSNNAVVASPAAGSDWQDPDQVAIWDASSGGNKLAEVAFTTDVGAPNTGQKLSFAIGVLAFDLGVAA